MEILPAFSLLLSNAAAITAKRRGGVFINNAPEGEPMPHVVILSAGGTEGLTHDGPVGLIFTRVRVWACGKTDREAIELASAIDREFHGWAGSASGVRIQQIMKVMDAGEFQNEAGIHLAILDFRIAWSRSS